MKPVTLVAVAAGIALTTFAAPAGAEPDPNLPIRISEKLVADLARADLDATSADASRYLGQNSAENLKNSFAAIKNLGQSQYSDLVYSRDFGQTEKDMIYKIDFDKAFLFVRLLYHIDHGAWRLIHLHLKTENEEPLPKEWVHIYPK